MKLPSLHRGYWIFQSPRILIILTYLHERGVSPEMMASIVQEHIAFVSKLSKTREKSWIVERLEKLGYKPKGKAKSVDEIIDIDVVTYYAEKLGLTQQMRERFLKLLSRLLNTLMVRDPVKSIAYLPPTLTFPEKVLLLDCLGSSQSFDLHTSLRVVIEAWLRDVNPLQLLEGDYHACRREFRFRYTYLMSLGLITGRRDKLRPTSLGLTVYEATNNNVNPASAYVRYVYETDRIRHMVLLDIASLDLATRDILEKYVDLVVSTLKEYMSISHISTKELLAQLTEEVAYLPSDLKGVVTVTIMKDISKILQVLEL